jgi:hypothetical protein
MFARWARRLAGAATLLLVAGTTTVLAQAPAGAAVACEVTYAANDWTSGSNQGGFTANLAIRNLGDPLNGWTLTFDFPTTTQRYTPSGWGANWSQSGTRVTAANMPWNGALATGAGITVGFNGTWSGSNPEPTSFAINGTTCGGTDVNEPPTVSLTSPAAGQTFTAPATVPIAATAADPDGTIAKVDFYQGSTLLGTDTSSPYAYSWQNAAAGNYSITARATDDAGETTTSSPVGITVSTDSTPVLVVSPLSLAVPETGDASFGVRLSRAPTANVTVSTARASGDTDLTVSSGATRTFTPANWNTAQNVTIAAADDADDTSGTAVFRVSATGYSPVDVAVTEADNDTPGGGDNEYIERFTELYNELHDPANGYFSPEGVPYHSVETFMVEAPDHGHETTSEAYSYYLWLEAVYGQVTGDWSKFNAAWDSMETYIIPATADQPTNSFYDPAKPASYAAEHLEISNYPTAIDTSVSVGSDPIAGELRSAYGTQDIYGMHWLLDVDNTYGFGRCGDGTTKPAYINTYQRGPEESVFETIPQPSCDTFAHGGTNGFLDLFIDDSAYAKQWKYTNAPDADARAVQVAYWAQTWAEAQGKESQISATVAKAAKMGDYLRYSMYDKYFKQPGCTSPSCPAGTGKNSANYLLSWYYAWGGATDANAGWAWRIGSSHNHAGYQNPFAAWALANVSELRPLSSTGAQDWSTSLTRQLQFYTWLQSAEGAIAGGATNSWNGHYATPPSGLPKFHGMAYDWQPVYHDPPSNQWFGFQAWTMERVAELYNVTGNADAKALLDKWVAWAMDNTTINADGSYQIPSTLRWTGQPAGNFNATSGMPPANPGLHVEVLDHTQDVGVAGSYAKVLMYYAARAEDAEAQAMAKALLDGVWDNRDDKGVSVEETKADYRRVDDPVYVPPGWSGTMPNGDPINSDSTFLSIRSFYEDDPDWPKVEAFLDGSGPAPVFNYHRFWAQVDVAVALAEYGRLFP